MIQICAAYRVRDNDTVRLYGDSGGLTELPTGSLCITIDERNCELTKLLSAISPAGVCVPTPIAHAAIWSISTIEWCTSIGAIWAQT